MTIQKMLRENIKTYRRQKGLTQEELAELIDKTVETISYIECGKIYPRLQTLERIAAVLEVPFPRLFSDEPIPCFSEEEKELILETRKLSKEGIHALKAFLNTLDSRSFVGSPSVDFKKIS